MHVTLAYDAGAAALTKSPLSLKLYHISLDVRPGYWSSLSYILQLLVIVYLFNSDYINPAYFAPLRLGPLKFIAALLF